MPVLLGASRPKTGRFLTGRATMAEAAAITAHGKHCVHGLGLTACACRQARLPTARADRGAREDDTGVAPEQPAGGSWLLLSLLDIETGERFRALNFPRSITLSCCAASSPRERTFRTTESGHWRSRFTTRGLAMDAEWRPDVFHGLATGYGFPALALGTLLRVDDDLPAGHRLAHSCVAPEYWNHFSRPVIHLQRVRLYQRERSLFTHQYSQAWYDFRDKRDAYADYFRKFGDRDRAHKAFCLSYPSGYSEDYWGITASDSVGGYTPGVDHPHKGLWTGRLFLRPRPARWPSCPRSVSPFCAPCVRNGENKPGTLWLCGRLPSFRQLV